MKNYTDKQLDQLRKLLKYSDRYDLSIQFWVEQTVVYITKGDVELNSFGGDFNFAINSALKYLNRINKIND